jgi:integrase
MRRELWRSMKTNEVSCARLRAARMASLTADLWLALEQAMTMQEGEVIVLEWFRAEVDSYDRLRSGLMAQAGRLRGPSGVREPVRAAPVSSPAPSEGGKPTGVSLKDAGRRFVLEVGRTEGLKPKRLRDYEVAVETFLSWLTRDPDLSEITASVAGHFKSDLTRCPSRGSVRPGYVKLSIPERIARATEIGETDLLDATTINTKYLGPLRKMFDFHRRSGLGDLIERNPFEGISATRGRKASRDKKRRELTALEVQQLFAHPVFTGSRAMSGPNLYLKGDKRVSDWRYWIPLICLFSGVRLNEACGIALKDFREEAGVHYYLVRDATDGQSLKSDAGWRRIPIHRALLELGFLSFVEQRKREGGVRLFDDLKEDASGYLSAVPSKFLNRLLERIKDPDPDVPGKLTFHSTRHTVIGRLRAAEVRLDVSKELVGHEDGDVHAAYGGVDLTALKAAVDKISYPGVAIDAMRL